MATTFAGDGIDAPPVPVATRDRGRLFVVYAWTCLAVAFGGIVPSFWYPLATTGFAGPTGGTADCPVGTVWLAVASAAGCVTRKVFIQGTRERIQARAASAALQLTWDLLNKKVTID